MLKSIVDLHGMVSVKTISNDDGSNAMQYWLLLSHEPRISIDMAEMGKSRMDAMHCTAVNVLLERNRVSSWLV
jgi:hypothetical protein